MLIYRKTRDNIIFHITFVSYVKFSIYKDSLMMLSLEILPQVISTLTYNIT